MSLWTWRTTSSHLLHDGHKVCEVGEPKNLPHDPNCAKVKVVDTYDVLDYADHLDSVVPLPIIWGSNHTFSEHLLHVNVLPVETPILEAVRRPRAPLEMDNYWKRVKKGWQWGSVARRKGSNA